MKSYDEIIEEYKYDWVSHIDGPVFFEEEYLDGRPLDDFYHDQAPKYLEFFDRRISSVYLYLGLRRMEQWMINQIIKGSEYSKEDLIKMIERNPHLHNVIKTNLLENLNNSYREN